ncbi:type VII secretion protein EccE [Asanoa ishikariensis]|uniref:Type VII secretion protein EccE n=2 Tax=Asanoa ishikariensis TaxID=137265 RepID=A0A1H3LE93_9ACTN|nr:type VII secretion protein EccE [Asanoa ishikariensis]
MTSMTVDPSRKAVRSAPQWMRIRAGQVVTAQVAVALVLVAVGRGPLLVSAAGAAAAVLVVVAFARVRGRWLFDWLATGVRYATRRHALPAHTTPEELARFLAPDLATTHDGGFVDADGLVTVFELDEPVLAVEPTALPDIAALIARAAEPPHVRLDLLVATGRPRTARTAAAASYRQLTYDRVLPQRRTFVVVRVVRPPGWSDSALRPTMSGITRRVARRIGPHRRLDHDDALATVAELAHHDGRSGVDDRWPFVAIGGLWQACYRMTLASAPGDEGAAHRTRAMGRLLSLPAAATTVSAAVTSAPEVRLHVRLAGESPQHLAHADRALGELAAVERATVQRLDGDHRFTVAETLPFGGHSRTLGLPTGGARAPTVGPGQARAPESSSAAGDPGRPRPSPRPRRGPSPVGAATASEVLPPAGMVLGYDRHGAPVVARVFRPTGTRIVVAGELRTAQILTLRALALGTRIDVRTRRWAAWHEFAEEIGAAAGAMTVTPDAAPLHRWVQARGSPPIREPIAGPTTDGSATAHRNNGHPQATATPWEPLLTIVDVATRGTSAGRQGTAATVERDTARGTPARRQDTASAATVERDTTRGTPARRQDTASAATVERDTDGMTASGHPREPAVARSTRRHMLEVGGEDDLDAEPGAGSARPSTAPEPGARWQAVLTVRDELTEADVDLLTTADLVVLGTLRPPEAAIAADALGFGAAADWLTRIRDDMVAVVSGDALRWAVLATTPIERSVVGPATRWGEAATPSDVDASQPVTRPGNSL